MGFKVKRASPHTRTLNVPVGVAWDAEAQRVMIPHCGLTMPDGRTLAYAGPWHVAGDVDGATWHTSNGMRVGATISEAYPTLGPLLQVSLLYLRKDPSWQEITGVKDVFFGPNIPAMMLLPQEANYIHGWEGHEDSHIFHIWQMPPTWEQELWP